MREAWIRIVWLLFGLTVTCTTAGGAQEVRAVRVEADNDYFNFWLPPDERPDVSYTHGTRIRVEAALRPWWAGMLGWEEPVCAAEHTEAACVLTGFELGQALYTPFRDASLPIAGDRPYAGWLYLGVMGRTVWPDGMRALGLHLGVTGEPALAEEVQDLIHRWFEFRKPRGWAHQIPFEPGVVLLYEEARVWPRPPEDGAWSAVVEPEWGAALGNVRTAAHAGFGLRVSWNRARPDGWRSVRPTGLHGYVAAKARGTFVLRDLFLDGSTWRESVHVEREPWVMRRELRLGAGWRGIGLEYRIVHTGKEFRTQPEPHTYSSVVVIVRP